MTHTHIIVVLGSPAAGKSAVSNLLVRSLNDRAVNGDRGNWVYIDKDLTTRHLQTEATKITNDPVSAYQHLRDTNVRQLFMNVANHVYYGSNVILSGTFEGYFERHAPWAEEFENLLANISDNAKTGRIVNVCYIGLTVCPKVRHERLRCRGESEEHKTHPQNWARYMEKVQAHDAAMGSFVNKIDTTNRTRESLAQEIWHTAQTKSRVLAPGQWELLPNMLRNHLPQPARSPQSVCLGCPELNVVAL